MEKELNSDNGCDEDGEKRLADLIKKAGDDARWRRKKIMEQHYAKLRAVIGEAVLERQGSIIK